MYPQQETSYAPLDKHRGSIINQQLLLILVVFAVSLIVTMSAAAWFTRRLEHIAAALNLSPGLLSLLGALGANIPNYIASLFSIASGEIATGLGIIIGSNIYNVAIILSIAAFAAPNRHGIMLTRTESHDARIVGRYSLAIMLATLLLVWLLPDTPLSNAVHLSLVSTFLLVTGSLVTLGIGVLLTRHALRREPELTQEERAKAAVALPVPGSLTRRTLARRFAEMLLALTIALVGVVVMVQSGQRMTDALHMPAVLAGLLVLAVATSLPNTVVAFILARANQESACVEEIFSSNSINAVLGIALPLLFWHDALTDRLLLMLDTPLMVALTLIALLCTRWQRVSRLSGGLLLLVYVLWVVAHVWF